MDVDDKKIVEKVMVNPRIRWSDLAYNIGHDSHGKGKRVNCLEEKGMVMRFGVVVRT